MTTAELVSSRLLADASVSAQSVPGVSQTRAARLAGALYLITMATGVFGTSFVRSTLAVPGDAEATARNIIASEQYFRLGIVSDLATSIGVLVLLWALYVLLRPVNRDLALLAAFLRLVENAVLIVTCLGSLVVLMLLGGAPYLKVFEPEQLHALARLSISALAAGFNVGFIALGLGSSVFAYLLWRSRYIPRALAGLGVFSSLLLSAGAVLTIMFPHAAAWFQFPSMLPLGLYEVTLGAWLLFKGADVQSRAV